MTARGILTFGKTVDCKIDKRNKKLNDMTAYPKGKLGSLQVLMEAF